MQQIDERYSDTVRAVHRVRDEMRARVVAAERDLHAARAAYDAAEMAAMRAELVEDEQRRRAEQASKRAIK